MSINPNENSILTPQRPVPDVRLGYASTGQSIRSAATRWAPFPRWSRFERQVGGSWRVDETFIKVRGQLMYLYRAVDGQGNTVEFCLSRTRGIAAAKAFFRKALKHHREPHMGMNGEFNFRGPNPVRIRCCQYLNKRCGAGPPPGEGAIAPDVEIQDVLQCATRHYRHRTGAEDSQTPVRNSDLMAVKSRGDLASRHGSIVHIAGGALLILSLRQSYLHQNPPGGHRCADGKSRISSDYSCCALYLFSGSVIENRTCLPPVGPGTPSIAPPLAAYISTPQLEWCVHSRPFVLGLSRIQNIEPFFLGGI